jgi:hypothetical protein
MLEKEALAGKDITPYRQPMVTSLGIMMGFLLNFMANWAIDDEESAEALTAADWTVVATLLGALSLMCIVLYRILDIRAEPDAAAHGYVNTFRIYIASVILAFVGLGIAVLV